MIKAVKTRFLSPYTVTKQGNYKTNLDNLRENPATAGVYLIKSDRTGKIIYVGYSATQLYKTIYRHFQTWNDRQQPRKTYNKTGYTVRVIFTTKTRAALLESYLINKLKPRDNKDKLQLIFKDQKREAESIIKNTELVSKYADIPF